MTVVSAMKFNDKEGAIIADEQSSTRVRTYDIAEKIHVLSAGSPGAVHMLYGGSGGADFLFDVHKNLELNKGSAQIDNSLSAVHFLNTILGTTKDRYKTAFLKANLGVSLHDIQRGFTIDEKGEPVRFDEGFKQNAWNVLNGNQELAQTVGAGFVVLTFDDNNGTELYTVETPLATPVPCPRPYVTIGSGQDQADGALYAFFERVPRAERKTIDPICGIAALLNATNIASRRNVGVGGTPYLSVLKDGKVITPNENQTRLAGEVVRAHRRNYVSHEFLHKALTGLVYEDAGFAEIDDAMWAEAGNKQKDLGMLLRGYKK